MISIVYGSNNPDHIDAYNPSSETRKYSIFGWAQTNAPGDFGPDTDNDYLAGSYSDDRIDGGAGSDSIDGYRGNNTLFGGTGDDLIVSFKYSKDQIFGGDGIDTLWVEWYFDEDGRDMTISVASPDIPFTTGTGTTIFGVERLKVTGGTGSDSFTGGQYADFLAGGEGSDTLIGGGGNDTLYAADRWAGIGTWSDWGSTGFDLIRAGGGNDVLIVQADSQADTIDGGAGIDLLRFEAGASHMLAVLTVSNSITLSNGSIVTGVERIDYVGFDYETLTDLQQDSITGGNLDDTLIGNGGDDYLSGGAGNDSIAGAIGYCAGGIVSVYGGAGDDHVNFGKSGAGSVVYGGAGLDLINIDLSFVSGIGLKIDLDTRIHLADGTRIDGFEYFDLVGTSANDTIAGGAVADTLNGGGGDDSVYAYGGNDVLTGGDGTDSIFGGAGDDTLLGNVGSDELTGGEGNDVLTVDIRSHTGQVMYGGGGDDNLFGDRGDDTMTGGVGADTMAGNNGYDTFIFNIAPAAGMVDAISRFQHAKDTIQLNQTAFSGLTVGTLHAADFVLGTVADDDTDRILYDSATGAIWYDADGTGATAAIEFATLDPGRTLHAANFEVV